MPWQLSFGILNGCRACATQGRWHREWRIRRSAVRCQPISAADCMRRRAASVTLPVIDGYTAKVWAI